MKRSELPSLVESDAGGRRRLLVFGMLMPLVPLDSCLAQASQCYNPDDLPAEQKTLRATLGFRSESGDSQRRCGGCAFFSASSGNCGKCTLLSGGAVAVGNVCDSWADARMLAGGQACTSDCA